MDHPVAVGDWRKNMCKWKFESITKMKRLNSNLVFFIIIGSLIFSPLAMAQMTATQKFETLLPKIQLQLKTENSSLSFDAIKPIGLNGLIIENLKLIKNSSPQETISVQSLIINGFDFEKLDLDTINSPNKIPSYVNISAQGISLGEEFQSQLTALGITKSTYSVEIDYNYDAFIKSLKINKIQLSLDNIFSVSFSVSVEGFSVEDTNPDTLKNKSMLKDAALTINDKSLLKDIIPVLASINNMKIDDSINVFALILSSIIINDSPDTIAYADALVSFVIDWQSPKGPITFRLNPPAMINFDELEKISSLDEGIKKLGLQIAYQGTKAGSYLELSRKVNNQSEAIPKTTMSSKRPKQLALQSVARGEVKAKPIPIKGNNVSLIDYGTGKMMYLGKRGNDYIWQDKWNDGTEFELIETDYDEWSVYLHDPERDADIQIDLFKKKMIYDDGTKPKSKPYSIIDISSFYK